MLLRTNVVVFSVSLAASMAFGAPASNVVIPLDGKGWRIAVDPQNVGVADKWFVSPRPDAKATRIPSLIQGVFPGYAGVAWYWRDLVIPANPHANGRYLLRFWDVDYLADVWVNGTHIGRHEGAQARFTFDATAAVKPGAANRIAVRVLSLWNQEIDGFIRGQTPHGGYKSFNFGGILDSVELLVAPQVRMDDLFVRADPATGKVRIEAGICNESKEAVQGSIEVTVASAGSS
jgi:beta-galactosidase/beta-glucuronidase